MTSSGWSRFLTFFITFSVLGTAFILNAQPTSSVGTTFAAGVKAYKDSAYSDAIQSYEQALNGKVKSSEAYNNLALAYFKEGVLGKAILNFERAIRHNPYNKNAIHNLKAAKQHINTPIEASKVFWFFLFLAAIGFIIWYNQLQTVQIQSWSFKIAVGASIIAIFPLIWGFQAVTQEHYQQYAIVISSKAGIRNNPDIGGEDILVITEGVKAKLLKEIEGWKYIRLENGVLGWIPSNLLEVI